MKRTNAVTEGAMAAALFAVLLLLFLYIPVIYIVIMWFLPLPFIVYVLRNGIKPGLVLWAVTFALALLFANVLGLFIPLVFGGGGLVAGVMYRQRRSAFAVLLAGSLAYTACLIIVFVLSTSLMGFNFITDAVQMMRAYISTAEQMAGALGEDTGNRFDALKKQIGQLRYLAPMFIVFTGVLYALITQLVAMPVLKRMKLGDYVQQWVPFREWRFPKSFLWYYLIVFAIGFFQHFTPGSPWFIIYYNLFAILQWIIMIQGFSFIFFFFHSKNLPRAVGVATVIFVFLFWWLLLPLVRIAGIIDLGFDMRKRLRT